jgi:hypothetical protein
MKDILSDLRIKLADEAKDVAHWVVLCLRQKLGVPTPEEVNKISAEKKWPN